MLSFYSEILLYMTFVQIIEYDICVSLDSLSTIMIGYYGHKIECR